MNRDKIYAISTDIENFTSFFSKYFKSIKIRKETGNEVFADEIVCFLGGTVKIKTRHVVVRPNIHEVHILSGLLRGSSFVESYEEINCDGTIVTIKVSVCFNGISKLLAPFGFLLKRQMSKVMEEFLHAAEEIAGTKT